MLLQLVIGSGVISLTIVVEAAFIGITIVTLKRFGSWLSVPPHAFKTVLALMGVTLWLLAALSICVWLWAATYITIGLFEELEPALYFSVVAFTTLGFGDVTLPESWRLLSGLSAANGLLLFGLNTAFLVEFMNQLRHAQTPKKMSA